MQFGSSLIFLVTEIICQPNYQKLRNQWIGLYIETSVLCWLKQWSCDLFVILYYWRHNIITSITFVILNGILRDFSFNVECSSYHEERAKPSICTVNASRILLIWLILKITAEQITKSHHILWPIYIIRFLFPVYLIIFHTVASRIQIC